MVRVIVRCFGASLVAALLLSLAVLVAPAGATEQHRSVAEPHWVYQMVNDFNLGISAPSGFVQNANLFHHECSVTPPSWSFVDANSASWPKGIQVQFVGYSKLLPRWIAQAARLKSTAATRLALAKLKAQKVLHQREVTAWLAALADLKAHQCAAFIGDVRAAAKAGAPGWADGYLGVKAIAGLYGQGGSVSHQTPYAGKIG